MRDFALARFPEVLHHIPKVSEHTTLIPYHFLHYFAKTIAVEERVSFIFGFSIVLFF